MVTRGSSIGPTASRRVSCGGQLVGLEDGFGAPFIYKTLDLPQILIDWLILAFKRRLRNEI